MRLAALAVVGLGSKEQCCIGGWLIFFAARLWCDVPAAASNAKLAAACARVKQAQTR